ncbi:hypothetical protein DPMN_033165 [Dreissena polymorpha]|uniref:EF-hand domain-containing protein n=2 Tax=Dreissena polymorpha TaxID=45954 RepID=A0A9D4RKR0_DREPO|nr:hypothetical protein DPMN_033165 [Dreissena polymorpha]
MSYEDFIANFDECQMCHLQPDGVNQELSNLTNKKNWSVTMYHDAWLKGVTAGGCGNPPNQDLYWRNPQFQVHLAETDATDGHKLCTMMVSLMEKERPDVESKVAVGFDVYQVDSRQRRPLDGKSLPRSALIHREGTGTYQHYREVARRFQLAPGYYVIIPSTFNPHQEADFLLRVYTEKEVESEVMDEHGSPTPPSRPIGDPLEALYRKHAGEDGRMDFRELETFLMDASLTVLEDKISFGKEACRSLLSLMDRNHSGYVTFSEAKDIVRQIKAYTTVFRQFDVNRSNNADAIELETMFRRLGFPVSRTVLASIVRRYGGRDAKIELEDFIVVMCKLVVMYDIFKEKHLKTGGQTDVAHFSRNEFLQYTFC